MAAASPVITTAKLEELALHIFGSGTLPKMEGMSDTAKREALARELWQAFITVPGAEVSAADAHAKHWRRAEKLTGAFATIAHWRQNRANAFLNLPAADNRPRMPRAEFSKLTPQAQREFSLNGGRLTE